MATTSSLQNINWLNKLGAVYIKEKDVYFPSLIPSSYNVFLYILEEQVNEDSKLGIMTNVGKNRLVKVNFTNIHKISDAYASSFCRYIVTGQCMRNVSKLFWENGVFEKIKAHLPQQPPALQEMFSPHILILFKKNVSPSSFKKEGRDYPFYM